LNFAIEPFDNFYSGQETRYKLTF